MYISVDVFVCRFSVLPFEPFDLIEIADIACQVKKSKAKMGDQGLNVSNARILKLGVR